MHWLGGTMLLLSALVACAAHPVERVPVDLPSDPYAPKLTVISPRPGDVVAVSGARARVQAVASSGQVVSLSAASGDLVSTVPVRADDLVAWLPLPQLPRGQTVLAISAQDDSGRVARTGVIVIGDGDAPIVRLSSATAPTGEIDVLIAYSDDTSVNEVSYAVGDRLSSLVEGCPLRPSGSCGLRLGSYFGNATLTVSARDLAGNRGSSCLRLTGPGQAEPVNPCPY